MEGGSGRTRGWGGTCGGAPWRRFGRRNKSTKNKREGDGAVALDGCRLIGGHNNQPNSAGRDGGTTVERRDEQEARERVITSFLEGIEDKG